jgi:RNA recognition motif-containing protein
LASARSIGYTSPDAARPRIANQKESNISNKIFVGNLSFETTREELSTLLSQAGKVARVHIGTDRETGRSRGFAFAEFGSDTEAADAIRKFDGYDLGGRRLRVNSAEDRPQRPAGGSPGGYRPPPPSQRPAFSAPQNIFAAGDPFASEVGVAGGRPNRSKGSRRGLRARKRSLGGY